MKKPPFIHFKFDLTKKIVSLLNTKKDKTYLILFQQIKWY